MKSSEKKMILILLGITIIALVIFLVSKSGNKEDKVEVKESDKSIIEQVKEVSQEEKNNYEISDVKVNVQGSRTTVTGKIKNNTKNSSKISVGVKFYSNENRVKGSGNQILEGLKAGDAKDFEIVIMGNMTGYTHKVEVEYTN